MTLMDVRRVFCSSVCWPGVGEYHADAHGSSYRSSPVRRSWHWIKGAGERWSSTSAFSGHRPAVRRKRRGSWFMRRKSPVKADTVSPPYTFREPLRSRYIELTGGSPRSTSRRLASALPKPRLGCRAVYRAAKRAGIGGKAAKYRARAWVRSAQPREGAGSWRKMPRRYEKAGRPGRQSNARVAETKSGTLPQSAWRRRRQFPGRRTAGGDLSRRGGESVKNRKSAAEPSSSVPCQA